MTNEEAIKVLNETRVMFGRSNGKALYREALRKAIDALKQPEIIHCKDCKHWEPHSQHGWDDEYGLYFNYCAFHMPEDDYYAGHWEAEDYCSYAERRTDE